MITEGATPSGTEGAGNLAPSLKIELLGQLAVTLLPADKLRRDSPRGRPFETEIHDFLVKNFNGYTVASGNISGHWKDDAGHDHYGEHRQYKVALPDRAALESFQAYLTRLATELDEECIYVELGREIFLIYRAGGAG